MDTPWFIFLMFAIGLVLIIKGGDWFVDAAAWIARVSGIPSFIIGATIVSLATTMPELLVSSFAAYRGSADMAVGNAIGSVTANTALILAIALLFIPSVIKRKEYLPKCLMLLAAVVTLYLGSLSGALSLWASIVLIGILICFVWENITVAKREMKNKEPDDAPRDKKTVIRNIIKFVLGIAGIIVGAQLLVTYGQKLATDVLGVPEAIVAVTMVAIGTSLPELVTTITAITKKQASLSAGNIIGANIIDMAMILPVCSVVSGKALPIGRQSILLDFPACLAVSALALIPALLMKKFSRWQGVALLVCYAGYLVLLIRYFV